MTECYAIQQSDEMYCASCNLRWDVNDRDAPSCRKSVPEVEPTSLVMRATLEAVAAGYHDLLALQATQRKTMARMLKMCVIRLNSPDSKKRREAISALTELMAMLEKQK